MSRRKISNNTRVSDVKRNYLLTALIYGRFLINLHKPSQVQLYLRRKVMSKIYIIECLIFNFFLLYYFLANFPKLPLKIENDKLFRAEDELDI